MEIMVGVHIAQKDQSKHNIELCVTYHDINVSFKHVVNVAEIIVSVLQGKEWG